MGEPVTGSLPGRRRKILLRIGYFAAIAIGLWWTLHELDPDQLWDAATYADPTLLVAAALANLASQVTRAVGWKVLIPAPIPFRRLIRYEFSAQAASAVSPEGAGELIRIGHLRGEGISATTTISVMATRKLMSSLGLVSFTPLLATAPSGQIPAWAVPIAIGYVTMLVILLLAVLTAAKPIPSCQAGNPANSQPADPRPRWRRLVAELRAAAAPLRRPTILIASLAAATATRLLDFAAALLVLAAFDLPAATGLAVLVLLAIEVSNILPTAPAQIGTFEAAVLLAMSPSLPQGDVLAFALTFHLQQIVPQVLAGLAVTPTGLNPRRSVDE